MYHLVVPIDFSPESLHGLELAIIFSRNIDCKITMVYVQKKSMDYNPGSKEQELRFAKDEFTKLIEKYSVGLAQNVKLDYIIKTGRIYREIVTQAESYNNSFIVTSTHGASGFEKFFIGSNAFKIISATSKPVITIRGNKLPKKISKIVFPLDITADTRQKLPFTAELAKLCNAEIHVLSISSLQTEDITKKLTSYSNQVCDYLEKRNIKHVVDSLTGSDLVELILNYSKMVKADLISIMTEQVSDSNYIMGTAAQQILNKSEIPVLSINPKELHV
jgi:nucleotide-binding universal stress UspA family protein